LFNADFFVTCGRGPVSNLCHIFYEHFFIVIAAMERGFRAEHGGEAAVAACEFLGRDLGAVLLCVVVLSLALKRQRMKLASTPRFKHSMALREPSASAYFRKTFWI
jgi:hypothetical protein